LPIELLGTFTKPFALMIRLFANMSAGHIVVMSLIGLIYFLKSSSISFPLTLVIYLLEVLVAFLQAYIFTMLSALFIGMAVQDHEHEHAH
jgi:F-type H+-transporting ATPase subunit a